MMPLLRMSKIRDSAVLGDKSKESFVDNGLGSKFAALKMISKEIFPATRDS